MRSLFATPRRRLAARVALYGTAIVVGLPLATSQMLVGTIRTTTLEPWPPWEQIPMAKPSDYA